MNPACQSCLDYPASCSGSDAESVAACFSRVCDTSCNSSFIESDPGSFQAVRSGADGSVAAPADGGEVSLRLSAPAHFPEAIEKAVITEIDIKPPRTAAGMAIFNVLLGRATPNSVPPRVLYAALQGDPAIKAAFRARYGTPQLAIVCARAVAAEILADFRPIGTPHNGF